MAATITELLDVIQDNAGYSASDSLTMARLYETALIEYMHLLPSSSSDQGSSQAFDMATSQMLLSRVTAFINGKEAVAASSAANSRVRFLTFSEGFRR